MKSPLDLDEATMRGLAHQVTDVITSHLASVRDQPVIASASRSLLNEKLSVEPPSGPASLDSLLSILGESVFPYHAREPHPGFMAYVPSCPTFPSLLGDWIATGFNFYAGVWSVAGGPNQIEMVVLDWIRRWTRMPEGATGLLTSGGSAANLTAMVAARHRSVEGGAALPSLTVYTSAQAHSSVVRAAWVAGITRDNVRIVATDASYRMLVDDLALQVARDREAGLHPCIVAASAGTTNTGSVDPLHQLADFCDSERLWFHVDAAYAGFAVLTQEGSEMLSGMERADTLTLDPHKWLFVPFECGCLMAKDPASLTSAFRILPEYLKDVEPSEEEVNFADRGVQLTRYSRALKIWMSVSYFGVDAISDAIRDGMERATLLQGLIENSPEFEVLCPAQFGIVCFRACPSRVPESALDGLNDRINRRVVDGARFFISSTRLDGRFSLRVCTLGFRTTKQDMQDLFDCLEAAMQAETRSLESGPLAASGIE